MGARIFIAFLFVFLIFFYEHDNSADVSIQEFRLKGKDPQSYSVQTKNLHVLPSSKPNQQAVSFSSNQAMCNSTYYLKKSDPFNFEISFGNLLIDSSGQPYVSCRLLGKLLIPKGFQLNPKAQVHANLIGYLQKGGDNFTGRLKIGVGRFSGTAFKVAYFNNAVGSKTSLKTMPMSLRAKLPIIGHSSWNCQNDTLWDISFFVEATKNGAAIVRIDNLRIGDLTLIPFAC